MGRNEKGTRAEALHAFVEAHPEGWSHPDWERLLHDLRGRGLVAEGEEGEIGAQIERARLTRVLSSLSVPGLGPKRREGLAEAYGRLWELRHAPLDEVAALPGMTRPVAEALLAALR